MADTVVQPVQAAPVAQAPVASTAPLAAKPVPVSDLPYHNKTTEKLAIDRAKEVKADKPYAFRANGYTVTEKDAVVAEGADAKKVYVVTADGFEASFADKRSAEIYVTTHAPFIKS